MQKGRSKKTHVLQTRRFDANSMIDQVYDDIKLERKKVLPIDLDKPGERFFFSFFFFFFDLVVEQDWGKFTVLLVLVTSEMTTITIGTSEQRLTKSE